MSSEVEKIVEFKIHRFDPKQKRHYVSTYKIPVRKGTTLLDALMYTKDNLDENLRLDTHAEWECVEAAESWLTENPC